jgi:hypothetical protein
MELGKEMKSLWTFIGGRDRGFTNGRVIKAVALTGGLVPMPACALVSLSCRSRQTPAQPRPSLGVCSGCRVGRCRRSDIFEAYVL